MTACIPLTNSDLAPWLATLNHQLLSALHADRCFVLAFSDLKENYRLRLLKGVNGVEIIYLKGSHELLLSRLSTRQGHFMKPNMLQSQLKALEEPQNAFVLDASMPLHDMLDTIVARYFTPERSSKLWD